MKLNFICHSTVQNNDPSPSLHLQPNQITGELVSSKKGCSPLWSLGKPGTILATLFCVTFGELRSSRTHSLSPVAHSLALIRIMGMSQKHLNPRPIYPKNIENGALALVCLGNPTGDSVEQSHVRTTALFFPPVCGYS